MAIKPYYEERGITIYHGDCRDVLADFPDKSFDVQITDPPYSEHVHENARSNEKRPGKKRDAHRNEDVDLGFDPLARDLQLSIGELTARLVRRWTCCFTDIESVGHWKSAFRRVHLEHIRVGLWVKTNPMPQQSGDRPGQGYECIEIVHPAGQKKWNGGGKSAIYHHAITRNRVHKTQKPDVLIAELVRDFTEEGETILDMCMGAGAVLRVAKRGNRKAVGIDVEERWCEYTAKSLRQNVLDF